MAPPLLQAEITDSSFHTSISTSIPILQDLVNASIITPTSPQRTIIFFISGNPGLIQYYHSFLEEVAEELSSSFTAASSPTSSQVSLSREEVSSITARDSDADQKEKDEEEKAGSTYTTEYESEPQPEQQHEFHIYGTGLAGFETNYSSPSHSSSPGTKLYNLSEQIDFVEGRLTSLITSLSSTSAAAAASSSSSPSQTPVNAYPNKLKVILIGHSVGSYMCMELMRRLREKYENNNNSNIEESEYIVAGSILLFPTVMELAKSDAGIKLTRLLRLFPHLHIIAHIAVKILTALLPTAVLRWLVRMVMQSPPPEAVETTVKFLRSPRGVRQALYVKFHVWSLLY
jgi:hypothetical protein